MQVDFTVELGADDETLELPWAGPDGGPRYFDLKRKPEALEQLEEGARFPELAEFLAAVNSPLGPLETAKCDAWVTTEIHPQEESFGAPWKFGSYVDLVFTDRAARFSFEAHEKLLENLTGLLKHVPDLPASAEFLLRRCFYHEAEAVLEGYYVTFYLFGYGKDGLKAREQWGIALRLAHHAIAQQPSRRSCP